jgi:hypothetical protein
MKNYGLYTKGNNKIIDIVNKVQAQTLEDAISFFAKVKKLSKKNLIDIWDVKEITN